MRLIHRVGLPSTQQARREVAALGVEYEDGITIMFDIAEDDPRWPAVAEFISTWKPFDFLRTEWNAEDRRSATRLVLEPSWHHGYPQPERDFKYLAVTYDLSEYCPECGMGAVQRAPFRMRAEPKWRRNHVLQLNWVFDEYFAKPEVWDVVFRPHGIGCGPVLQHRSENVLSTVVQLRFDRQASSALELGDHPFKCCVRCERRKYLPFARGCFPKFRTAPPEGQSVKTLESFGDGGSTYRQIVVPQVLYRECQQHKVRGCTFTPMCE